MSDCNCVYPALECSCCCKEKAVLQGLMNRLNGYECYLRTFVVPASCQNLPWSAQLATDNSIVGGGNPKYVLDRYVVGSATLSTIKVWPTVGCKCDFSRVSQAVYKLDNDCWGALPNSGETGVVPILKYLSGKYQLKTINPNEVTQIAVTQAMHLLLTNQTTVDGRGTRFGVLKGALEYIAEAKRHYHSILTSLPC
jgi:hypothetical protein